MSRNIAIVHDYLTNVGGAEMTVKAMAEIFPASPVYTLLYEEEEIGKKFIPNKIIPSFLRMFPRFLRRRRKLLLPYLAVAPETFDLREYEIVVASSGAFSKGVITKPNTMTVCYCHSPMRFAWDYTHEYLKELTLGRLRGMCVRMILNYLRLWDAASADRADYFIANSHATANKIRKYYRRRSDVIYPPVEDDVFALDLKADPAKKSDEYYLIVSRLAPYKKIDIAVEAFNKLGWNLKVIGDGPEEQKLKKIAGPTVEILGSQPRKKVLKYYQNSAGYILPGEEDFGISAVEAMAAGRPVLALRAGGALETVIEGKTGEFFNASTVEVLAEGVYRLHLAKGSYDPQAIRENARRFTKERFQRELKKFIEDKYEEFRNLRR